MFSQENNSFYILLDRGPTEKLPKKFMREA